VGHNWPVFHSTAGPALAVRDGAVMSASTGPAPGRRGMLTGIGKQSGESVESVHEKKW